MLTSSNNPYFTSQNISIFLIVILHMVGFVGLISGYQDLFKLLTPLHLLVTSIIVLFHFPKRTFLTITIVGILAWILEFIGVNTSFPFGEYTYGQTLGWKIGGTPVLIAANWLILLLSSNSF
ncbi:MAG: carotenoid biosynthesis protein, partial [Flavobacteriales bacterium]